MRKVVLIGDSIRMGYQDTVKRELEGLMDIWGPEANCGRSERILENLDEWMLSRDADIVHVNCGHHDLRKAFGADDSAIPLPQHAANVEEILTKILSGTNSKVIWATTTPVNEEWHHEQKGFDRFEADVAAYNRKDTETARRLGIQVNDLHAVVMNAGRDKYLQPDGVHFTEEGKVLLGKAVAAVLKACYCWEPFSAMPRTTPG